VINLNESLKILKVKIFKYQKTSILDKFLSLLSFERRIIKEINLNLKNIKLDLMIYSTPPITFNKIISYLKKKHNLIAYLLLKDIFPQNALDIGLLKKVGLLRIFYNYFRKKEKQLYLSSDYIGCMSKNNRDYILSHNKINPEKVHINPNSINVLGLIENIDIALVRKKYGLPLDKKIFIYGGNLGKPQGVPFILEVIKKTSENQNIFNIVVGDGTEAFKFEKLSDDLVFTNFKFINSLANEDFDTLLRGCDVGMVYLDNRFTIPNFPSRILSYMKNKLPIYAITDNSTDLKYLLIENDIGFWSEFGNINKVDEMYRLIDKEDLSKKREKAYNFLLNNYSVKNSYKIIMEAIK
jgi:glycosyltransferase involved in cell wall biosynthesis